MEIEQIEKKPITCRFCNFTWNTGSTRMYISCTNCRKNIKNIHYQPIIS